MLADDRALDLALVDLAAFRRAAHLPLLVVGIEGPVTNLGGVAFADVLA